MKTTEIMQLLAPVLDGRDEYYYIVFLTSGEVKFINAQYSSLLDDIAAECTAIYRYNYWKIDAKYVDGKFEEVEFGSDEYNRVAEINRKYLDSRMKLIIGYHAASK